jgi:hypothetical protein
VNIRKIHNFAPIRRLQGRIKGRRNRFIGDAQRAEPAHMQWKAELQRDVGRVLRQNVQRARAHIPETDNADIDRFHGFTSPPA